MSRLQISTSELAMQTLHLLTICLLFIAAACANFSLLPVGMISVTLIKRFTGYFNGTTPINGTIGINPNIKGGLWLVGHTYWQNVTGLGPNIVYFYDITRFENATLFKSVLSAPAGDCANYYTDKVTCHGWSMRSKDPRVYEDSCEFMRLDTKEKGSIKLAATATTQDVPTGILTTTIIGGTSTKYDIYLTDADERPVPWPKCWIKQ